ncbi:conjugative transposon protein TraN [Pedobacter frigoris]|uniref:conjugative transposon protein TraN n=1 Tax=Pedobacter frigoris TaxID=2571272 RepID=UPI00292F9FF9|nr:conjugative transposon protein TraN [Pedobacter frigoris]
MKRKCAVWIGMLAMILNLNAFAQEQKETDVQPSRLTITHNKTTNLIFPYAIKSADIGSSDVIAQKALGVENLLQIKAAKRSFDETNLTVVTVDGSFFSYLLNYTLSPLKLNIKAENPQIRANAVAVFSEDATTDRIKKNAEKVINNQRVIKNKRGDNNEVFLDLKGLYINGDVFYLQLYLQNRSVISYDVKSLKLYLRDTKRSKRTASQEIEVTPLYVHGDVKRISENSEKTVVIAVSKFTIPDKKRLEIEMMEDGGGRNMTIQIGNATIMNAVKVD